MIYADELGDETTLTLTREPPAGLGRPRRSDRCADSSPAAEPGVTAFVCGSNGFVEAASQLLLETGLDPGRIRTERFGPTG